ncbi:MAG: efflux RND transporter permease subunit [Myxococcota bacterium]|jgi:multidrug efflux pump
MILSDFSVRRPVVATVMSLLLVIVGLAAFQRLPVRQYPDIDPPVVSIDTIYRGASAEVVETKVTQLIEDRIAGLEGIEKLTSSSQEERSSIRVEFNLDREIDEAANDIRDRVARVAAALPEEAEPPEIAKVDNDTRAVMYLNVTSDRMSGLEITDYADRFLTDRFSTVPGVARVRISGERRYAMRIWLNRELLAAHRLTVADVEQALRAENVELPAGRLESSQREFTLRTDTGFRTPEEFGRLLVGRGSNGQPVHLAEVAKVRVGAENERNAARANGQQAVSLGIEQLSKANTLDVSSGVRAEIDRVQQDLPEGMQLMVNYDRAGYIGESIDQVIFALGFSIALVLLVIYVFLGSARATLIPAVVVPVSVIATFTMMSAFGFTINTLTLLGLVLAIGLVVDDAIVVVESIYRRIEEGRPALLAALEGSKEIGFAVIATTLVLVAVFVPLSFIEGDIGRLFNEFGITLAAAVIFSSFVALTLSPMMCSKLLRPHGDEDQPTRLARGVNRIFVRVTASYRGLLEGVVARPLFTLCVAAGFSALAVLLMQVIPSEYAPREDQGVFMMFVRAPEGASFDYMDRYAREIEAVLMDEVEDGPLTRFLLRLPGSRGGTGAVDTARFIVILDPFDERTESQAEISARLNERLAALPGVRAMIFPSSSLGIRSDGRPVELVIGGPDYEQLEQWRDILLASMEGMPELSRADSNYQERKPRMTVKVDRDRAATLGVSLVEIGRTLETMLGSRVVTTYEDRGREYDVIVQGEDADRAGPDDLTNLYVRSSRTSQLISLANLVTLTEEAGPGALNRFDRMRAITVEAALTPGTSLGEAVRALGDRARKALPAGARLSWDGESREFLESGSSLYMTFGLALLIVFLVLAAQFESFIHPIVILATVPLALTGALLGLWILGGTINIFSQIGAVLLIGLAAKNGVLIIEFANQLRDRGEEFEQALVNAACTRLRPIVMTSASTTFGALPLLLGAGAGSESRQPIGLVIVAGVVVSAVLTLFVVPALYSVMARNTQAPEHVARTIETLRAS